MLNRSIVARTLVGLLLAAGCSSVHSPQQAATPPGSVPTTQPGKELILDLGGGGTMRCAFIPAGKFMMGSSVAAKDHFYWKGPQHQVVISKPFYIGVFEVTQEQYEQMTGSNPSHVKAKPNPVTQVLWDDAVKFCELLSRRSGMKVRLPTEAEWEYSCRAGSQASFHFGEDADKLDEYAWYVRNSNGQPHPVGQKNPNRWGLCDMHGNVWEWCSDWYDGSYDGKDKIDPVGARTGAQRVIRGGAWDGTALYCRSSTRSRYDPYRRGYNIGFRVVVELE